MPTIREVKTELRHKEWAEQIQECQSSGMLLIIIPTIQLVHVIEVQYETNNYSNNISNVFMCSSSILWICY